MTAKEHNRLVGIFLMIHGGIQALIMLLISLIYGGMATAILLGAKNDEKFVGVFLIVAIAFVVIFSLLFLAPQVIGGWKMFKEKPNAKIWGIVGSITACMSFPLGTAAGVYGLWFLFGDYGKQLYDNLTNPNYLGEMNAVNDFQYKDNREYQPHNWK
ncbi:MAG: hypothetical protein HC846_14445 [Blastocatellia bacterium]|nr:hypothetical protein [Blastocatellia bacterium]